MPKRILYGVQGEGRGHATRSLQIIQWLRQQGHAVKVLTGGDALNVLSGRDFDLEEIPLLRYRFRANGSLNPWETAVYNAGRFIGLCLGMGGNMRRVSAIAEGFRPDAIISDFEPYLSHIARARNIPLLAINHQNFLTESELPKLPNWRKNLMLLLCRWGTQLLAGRPDRIITSSFYHFPKKKGSRAVFVGPFIPASLKGKKAPPSGDMLVYLKQACYLNDLQGAFAARPDMRFHVYANWQNGLPVSLPANVRVSPINRERFLEDLSRCLALISTAGNQVIGEAIYLFKPVLAFPEPDVLEQELNALALSRSGLGAVFRLDDFQPDLLDSFQSKIPDIVARMQSSQARRRAHDGRTQALRALRRFLIDIGGGSMGQARLITATRGGERRMPFLPTRERKSGLAVS